MPIINSVIAGGGSPTPTTRYGLNDKAWAGDLITDSVGNVTMRTDQAVGTLTGLETVTGINLNGKFAGSTGLVGAVNLGSVVYGGFQNAFGETSITSLNLKKLRSAGDMVDNSVSMCYGCPLLVSVDLSDLFNINQTQSPDSGIRGAFQDCTSLRELRLPALRLDSWYWQYDQDPDTGDEMIDYTAGIDDGLRGLIKGCSNLVVHLSSSLGEDLANLEGSDERSSLFNILCGYDSATMASCSVVYDLPPNDPFVYRVGVYGSYTANRQPSSDTATALAWYINDNSIVYTSGLSAPQVGDTVYSDSDCTVAASTIEALLPVYEYVEPEPEEEPTEGE